MELTNGMIKQIALQQSAIDANCKVEDFTCGENVVVVSKENILTSIRWSIALKHLICIY